MRFATYDAMNETLARLHNLDYLKIGLEEFGKPTAYVARQIARWTKQYQLSETEKIAEMDRLIDWLPKHLPAEGRPSVVHGDYRLDNMILHPTEAQSAGGDRLGTRDDRRSPGGFHLPPDAVADAAGRNFGRNPVAALGRSRRARHSDHGAICENVLRAHGAQRDAGTWIITRRIIFFRLAGILQGIVGRVRDGTAANANAAANAGAVRPLAERAWHYAQRAGATG